MKKPAAIIFVYVWMWQQ